MLSAVHFILTNWKQGEISYAGRNWKKRPYEELFPNGCFLSPNGFASKFPSPSSGLGQVTPAVRQSGCVSLDTFLVPLPRRTITVSLPALRPPADWRMPVGRPRTTWLRTIDDDLQYLNFGVHTAWRDCVAFWWVLITALLRYGG